MPGDTAVREVEVPSSAVTVTPKKGVFFEGLKRLVSTAAHGAETIAEGAEAVAEAGQGALRVGQEAVHEIAEAVGVEPERSSTFENWKPPERDSDSSASAPSENRRRSTMNFSTLAKTLQGAGRFQNVSRRGQPLLNLKREDGSKALYGSVKFPGATHRPPSKWCTMGKSSSINDVERYASRRLENTVESCSFYFFDFALILSLSSLALHLSLSLSRARSRTGYSSTLGSSLSPT